MKVTRPPAGSWPISELWPHVTMAGSGLHCAACGAQDIAPSPRSQGYGVAIESFLAQHKACAHLEEAHP